MSLRTNDLDPQQRYTLLPDENKKQSCSYPVMTFKLSRSLLERLQQGDSPSVEIDMTNPAHLTLYIDGESMDLQSHQENQIVDCYKRSRVGTSEELLYVGSVKKKLFPKPGGSGANERIKHVTQSEINAKVRNSVVVLDTVPPKAIKSSPKFSQNKTIRTNRPRNLASYKEDPGLERKLLHFLAPCPQSLEMMVKRFKVPQPMIVGVLQKIAKQQQAATHMYQLTNEAYRNLSPHDWTHYTPGEREKALRNAQIALDALGYQKDSAEWKAVMEVRPKTTLPPVLIQKAITTARTSPDDISLNSAPVRTQPPTTYDNVELVHIQYHSDGEAEQSPIIATSATPLTSVSMLSDAEPGSASVDPKTHKPFQSKLINPSKKFPVKKLKLKAGSRNSPPLHIANHSLSAMDAKPLPQRYSDLKFDRSPKVSLRSAPESYTSTDSKPPPPATDIPYDNSWDMSMGSDNFSIPATPAEFSHELNERHEASLQLDMRHLSDDDTLPPPDFEVGQINEELPIKIEDLYNRQLELYDKINEHCALTQRLDQITLHFTDTNKLEATIHSVFEEFGIAYVESDVFSKKCDDLLNEYEQTQNELELFMHGSAEPSP
ncbi:hypothetical protein QVD99_008092 [Batrachochytrium dendrobatidis]|nr:hypothetical protein O5D80_004755 [Batrachochytrium dendrobatidis]KAK5665246.1 hypothetical protein QVD99_008092 [Batrachochytrium dendrobatidis]